MRRSITLVLVTLLLLGSSQATFVAAARQGSTTGATSDPPPLPAPLAMPSGSPDDAAVTLARLVLTGGDRSLPALITALRASGIAVVDFDGKVLVAPVIGADQGYALHQWEVPALLDAEQAGLTTTVADLGDSLTVAHPALANAPIADFLLDGIRTGANGANPALRFWARFIVALGKYGSGGSDLLDPRTTPAAAPLGGIQTNLILRRLVADVWSAKVQLERAAGPPDTHAFSQPAASAPCQLGDVEGQILSVSSIAGSLGFGQLMGYLDNAGALGTSIGSKLGMTAAEKIAAAGGFANGVFAFAQLFFALAAFHGEVSMDPPGNPLVRTKTTTPGESRTLRMKVTFDIGNWQFINCIRPILQMAGLDLSQAMSQNGPVPGAEVAWHLIQGGVSNVTDPDPAKRQLTPLIQFHSGDITRTITDKDGVASAVVEGVPQKENLPGAYVRVAKPARIRATVALKTANLFGDVSTAVSTMLCGGPLAMGACAIPEMLLRSHLLFGATIDFQVIDWVPPEGLRVTHRTRVVSSTKGVGLDVTWTATVRDKDFDKESNSYKGTGRVTGFQMSFPANSEQCKGSAGEKIAIADDTNTMVALSPGWVTYSFTGKNVQADPSMLGIPANTAELGAIPVDIQRGGATAESTAVISDGDKCYGTLTQTDWVTVEFIAGPDDAR